MDNNQNNIGTVVMALFILVLVIGSLCRLNENKNVEKLADTSVVLAEEIDGPALDVEPPRVYFDVPLEKDLQDHIFDTCESYSVDPAIVVAMIERESTFRAGVIGDNNRSFGLMQIQPKWHMERMKKLGMYELLDPYQNIVVGVDFIHELLGYGKGTTWALMAYNGGPSYANKMRESGQVSDYAKDIIVRAHELERK